MTPLVALKRAGIDRADAVRVCGLLGLDRVRIRPAPLLMRRLWLGPVKAMTLGDTIFVDPALLGDRLPPSLVLHELVHVRQFRTLGWAGFLTRYLSEYVQRRRGGLSHSDAYRAISLELEAASVERFVVGK